MGSAPSSRRRTKWRCGRTRFSLTAEASLNDGTAFPFLLLGLGLLGLHDLGDPLWWRWIDARTTAGLQEMAIGLTLSTIAVSIVVHGLSVTPVMAVGASGRDASEQMVVSYALRACPGPAIARVFAATAPLEFRAR